MRKNLAGTMNLARPSLSGRENTTHPYAFCAQGGTIAGAAMHCAGAKLCKEWAALGTRERTEKRGFAASVAVDSATSMEEKSMRLLIKIAAAALLVVCIPVSSVAFAAGRPGRGA